MTFSVKLSSQAIKFLRKQDDHIAERLKVMLQRLKEPYQCIEHFEGDDCYKFRIGEYRALVDIDTVNMLVLVRLLDKRGRIYK